MSTTYQQLEPVIQALDDRIKTNLGAFPTDTAEGSNASFADGADDIPLKSLVVDINPVQDTSSGDPSPENICPISGWTGANVARCGKNLFDKSDTQIGVLKADGSVGSGATKYVSGYIKISPNTSYYLTDVIPANDGRSGFWYDANKNPIEVVVKSPSTLTSFDVTSPSNAEYIRIGCYIASVESCQLELGSEATPYEPYNGTTIPIDWQTEAGTVYGGSLDVLSGVLTIIDKRKAITDADNFGNYGDAGFTFKPNDMKSGTFQSGLCNLASTVSKATNYGVIFGSGNNIIYFTQAKSVWGVATTADAKQWAIDHGLELVYPLAEPIEIQLTPHEVRSLLGQNNIFADTGDTTVEYRADTKLYIERLTEPDADMIADANIVSGQYFMVGNKLYKATANIASGSAVIVGTNAIRKSLSEALNEINV